MVILINENLPLKLKSKITSKRFYAILFSSNSENGTKTNIQRHSITTQKHKWIQFFRWNKENRLFDSFVHAISIGIEIWRMEMQNNIITKRSCKENKGINKKMKNKERIYRLFYAWNIFIQIIQHCEYCIVVARSFFLIICSALELSSLLVSFPMFLCQNKNKSSMNSVKIVNLWLSLTWYLWFTM